MNCNGFIKSFGRAEQNCDMEVQLHECYGGLLLPYCIASSCKINALSTVLEEFPSARWFKYRPFMPY